MSAEILKKTRIFKNLQFFLLTELCELYLSGSASLRQAGTAKLH